VIRKEQKEVIVRLLPAEITCTVVSISPESCLALTPVAAISVMTVCMLTTGVIPLTLVDICEREFLAT
jgi:hypothetical protein